MAQHKSAEKRARSSKRRAVRNGKLRTKMRSAIKRVRMATEKEKAVVELKRTVKLLDQLVAKGVIHKNKAANSKSSITRYVNKLT
jgi:small subunit ribosomal protein S20